jgi:glycosyltransferase involved in cell wall biosynthesis
VGTVRTGKALPWLNWRSFRRLPLVISNTEWWCRELQRRGLEREKLAVIPNGLTFSWSWSDLRRLRANVRHRLGLEPDQPLLINVAGFRLGKRQEHLIRMLAKLPTFIPWRAALVGDGQRFIGAQRLARDLGLIDRITFTGALDDPAPFYAAADIAVSVSQEDALPNFLIEAQVAALPVVAIDYQGVREAFLDQQSGYLLGPDNEAGFMARLQELMNLPAKRKALGQRGREWARERFDPATCAQRHLELLRQYLAARA